MGTSLKTTDQEANYTVIVLCRDILRLQLYGSIYKCGDCSVDAEIRGEISPLDGDNEPNIVYCSDIN